MIAFVNPPDVPALEFARWLRLLVNEFSAHVDSQMKWSRSLLILTVFFRSSCRRTSLLQVSERLFTTLATFFPTKDKRVENQSNRLHVLAARLTRCCDSPQCGFGQTDPFTSLLHCMH